MLWYCASAIGAKARWAGFLEASGKGEGRSRAGSSESEGVEKLESEVILLLGRRRKITMSGTEDPHHACPA